MAKGLARKSPIPAIILLVIALAALLYSQYASSTAYASLTGSYLSGPSGNYIASTGYGVADFVLFAAVAGLMALYFGYYKKS